MGKFFVSSIKNIEEMNVGDEIIESDYSFISRDNKFIQLRYEFDKPKVYKTIVKPGIWTIGVKNNELHLIETSFVKDKILEDLVKTKDVIDKIKTFFKKLDIYKELEIEVPTRGCLIYGEPGTGKSVILMKVAESEIADGKTAVLIWPTSKFHPSEVKDFIRTFEYKGVEKLIFIMEDLGGIEVSQAKLPSDPALLSLLDNQEKIFTLPTMKIATTNFIHIFLSNLTNRSGRFDDKIEVSFPDANGRKKLLEFFTKNTATKEELELIGSKACSNFPPAHIKEVVIRHKLYDISIVEAIKQIQIEIKEHQEEYQKRYKLGL